MSEWFPFSGKVSLACSEGPPSLHPSILPPSTCLSLPPATDSPFRGWPKPPLIKCGFVKTTSGPNLAGSASKMAAAPRSSGLESTAPSPAGCRAARGRVRPRPCPARTRASSTARALPIPGRSSAAAGRARRQFRRDPGVHHLIRHLHGGASSILVVGWPGRRWEVDSRSLGAQ